MNPWPTVRILVAATAAAVVTSFAVEAGAEPPLQVRLVDVDSASYGSFVGVYGYGFGAAKGSVTFGGAPAAEIALWSDTIIIARVPAGATTGDVGVKTADGEEAPLPVPKLSVHTGTIYYVSNNTGDDSNEGTSEASPFRSWHKAMLVVQPGDTVLVRAGTYDETDASTSPVSAMYFRSESGGSSSKPITWRGYGAELPVVRGSQSLAQGSPILFIGGSFLRFARMEINGTNNNSTAVAVHGSNVWLTGLDVHSFAENGIYAGDMPGALIAANRIHDGGTHPNLDHAVVLTGQAAVLRDNLIANIPNGAGLLLQYPTQSTSNVYANLIHDVAGPGIALSRVKGGNRIFNNIIWKTGLTQGCLCALDIGAGAGAGEGSTGDRVYYNTFVGPSYTGLVLSDRAGPVELRSNIFTDVAGAIRVDDAASKAALSSSNNVWFGSDGDEPLFRWEGDWTDFASFQAESEQEADSIVADPRLVDAVAGDVHLTPSSPAIDMGGGLDQPVTDYEGNKRPNGAGRDVGAMEFTGTPTPDAGTGGSGGEGDAGGAGGGTGGGAVGGSGGSAATGGGTSDAGTEAGDAPPPGEAEDDGCGCSVPGSTPAFGSALFAAALAALTRYRRRRSSP